MGTANIEAMKEIYASLTDDSARVLAKPKTQGKRQLKASSRLTSERSKNAEACVVNGGGEDDSHNNDDDDCGDEAQLKAKRRRISKDSKTAGVLRGPKTKNSLPLPKDALILEEENYGPAIKVLPKRFRFRTTGPIDFAIPLRPSIPEVDSYVVPKEILIPCGISLQDGSTIVMRIQTVRRSRVQLLRQDRFELLKQYTSNIVPPEGVMFYRGLGSDSDRKKHADGAVREVRAKERASREALDHAKVNWVCSIACWEASVVLLAAKSGHQNVVFPKETNLDEIKQLNTRAIVAEWEDEIDEVWRSSNFLNGLKTIRGIRNAPTLSSFPTALITAEESADPSTNLGASGATPQTPTTNTPEAVPENQNPDASGLALETSTANTSEAAPSASSIQAPSPANPLVELMAVDHVVFQQTFGELLSRL